LALHLLSAILTWLAVLGLRLTSFASQSLMVLNCWHCQVLLYFFDWRWIKNNPKRLKIKHVWFFEGFLVLMKLFSLSQFYAPNLWHCWDFSAAPQLFGAWGIVTFLPPLAMPLVKTLLVFTRRKLQTIRWWSVNSSAPFLTRTSTVNGPSQLNLCRNQWASVDPTNFCTRYTCEHEWRNLFQSGGHKCTSNNYRKCFWFELLTVTSQALK